MTQPARKKTVLFLPFLQLPSGHHQAAKALMDAIHEYHPEVQCDKVDILSYSYGKIESLISNIYIKWIHAFPSAYSHLYQLTVLKNKREQKRYRLFELLFLSFLKKMLREKNPDFIICTHALPSYLLQLLKIQGNLNIPVLNVYTDYFIHKLWGIQYIDYHFVTSVEMKSFLTEKGVGADRIFVTGIPIHNKIARVCKPAFTNQNNYKVLISGGNLGAGTIEQLVRRISNDRKVQFYVLCGTNETLFRKLSKLEAPHIIPLSYITSKEKMNSLYEQVDAIITKPGGVTVSECLYKRKPIFIYHALPGQEEINMKTLRNLGLVHDLTGWGNKDAPPIDVQLSSVLNDKKIMGQNQERIEDYHSQISGNDAAQIVRELVDFILKQT
ncbi:MGDG synthase family glycosyltransferase [Peribacillus sp. SCS-155]|uniref:MGDG synthase family glycosyltransferase n=1 Tax=Peribacillus sedimenti TaxID=3115297 RepID=UPI003906616A